MHTIYIYTLIYIHTSINTHPNTYNSQICNTQAYINNSTERINGGGTHTHLNDTHPRPQYTQILYKYTLKYIYIYTHTKSFTHSMPHVHKSQLNSTCTHTLLHITRYCYLTEKKEVKRRGERLTLDVTCCRGQPRNIAGHRGKSGYPGKSQRITKARRRLLDAPGGLRGCAAAVGSAARRGCWAAGGEAARGCCRGWGAPGRSSGGLGRSKGHAALLVAAWRWRAAAALVRGD